MITEGQWKWQQHPADEHKLVLVATAGDQSRAILVVDCGEVVPEEGDLGLIAQGPRLLTALEGALAILPGANVSLNRYEEYLGIVQAARGTQPGLDEVEAGALDGRRALIRAANGFG